MSWGWIPNGDVVVCRGRGNRQKPQAGSACVGCISLFNLYIFPFPTMSEDVHMNEADDEYEEEVFNRSIKEQQSYQVAHVEQQTMHVILDLGPEMAPETIERLASEHAEISILVSSSNSLLFHASNTNMNHRILNQASHTSRQITTCFVVHWMTLSQRIYSLKSMSVNERRVVCYHCCLLCEQHKMKQKKGNHACQPNTWMIPTKPSFASKSP